VKGWPWLTQVAQELSSCLDTDGKRIFRLIHEGAKIFNITGKQVSCLTRQRGQENLAGRFCARLSGKARSVRC
jgi:hypothetical protein